MTAFQKWAAALAMIAISTPALAGIPQVPEPGTLGLLAFGLAGLVASTLRRRK